MPAENRVLTTDRYEGEASVTTNSAAVQELTAHVLFAAPGVQANGVAAAPEGLWMCDQQNNHCYLADYATGAMLAQFHSPVRNASGIAYGAGSVWVAANRAGSAVYRHDPATGHCLADIRLPDADKGGVHGIEWAPTDPDGLAALPPLPPPSPVAAAHIHSPGGEMHGDRGISGTLWVTRPGQNIIQWIDAETYELIRSIPFTAPRSHGAYWDAEDRSVVCAETNHNHIYRLDPSDGTVREEWVGDDITVPSSLASQSLRPGEDTPRFEVHGMTRGADGRVWACDAATNLVAVLQ